jgi:transposase
VGLLEAASAGEQRALWQVADHRQVINGVLHRVRTGAQWRDLPERFGPWKTVHKRHLQWSADGTWERLLQQVQAVADAEGSIDWDVLKIRVPRIGAGRPRIHPDGVSADKAYSNRRTRTYLRKRGIQHVIPEKADQVANRVKRGSHGGRPPGFDKERYKKRAMTSNQHRSEATVLRNERLAPITQHQQDAPTLTQ